MELRGRFESDSEDRGAHISGMEDRGSGGKRALPSHASVSHGSFQ
jgi:hypothetical protein